MPKSPRKTSLLFLCNILRSVLSLFLHADKHQNFLEIDTMVLMGMVKHFQSSQNSKFAMPLQHIKNEVNFLHADERQSFLQVDFSTLGVKVFYKAILSSILMGLLKHSQRLIVTSLQYLSNISTKKFGWSSFFACR